MAKLFHIKLSDMLSDLYFEEILMPCDPNKIKIISDQINRMGLELIGTLREYNPKRVMVMGKSEQSFLSTLTSEEIYKSVELLFSKYPPVLVVTRDINPAKEILEVAKKYSIPILSTNKSTSEAISELVSYLSVRLAPRITRSGGLLNVHGEGILIIGESGVGKSETTIELLNRGHKLITDDSVEIRRVSKSTLMGSAPENIRHFVEVRGIGIINARRIFGIGAIKLTEKIDMVINLETWSDDKDYDRLGSERHYTEILGVRVPYITIPVKPGRNLAVIIEVAAMNNRQLKLGYNATRELFLNLGMEYDSNDVKIEKCIWDI